MVTILHPSMCANSQASSTIARAVAQLRRIKWSDPIIENDRLPIADRLERAGDVESTADRMLTDVEETYLVKASQALQRCSDEHETLRKGVPEAQYTDFVTGNRRTRRAMVKSLWEDALEDKTENKDLSTSARKMRKLVVLLQSLGVEKQRRLHKKLQKRIKLLGNVEVKAFQHFEMRDGSHLVRGSMFSCSTK